MWATWPAGVLGPVVGWIRFSVTLPILAGALAAASGSWADLKTWAIILVCAAIVHVALDKVHRHWAVFAAINLMYAALLFLWGHFWNSVVGNWWALTTGITGGLVLVAWDGATRWGLARSSAPRPASESVAVAIDIGVLWGFVETSSPTLLGLNDGTHVELSPGCRYVWWLKAQAKEPSELLVPIEHDDFSAN